ncbi:MAG: tyrosine-type recombinase/integrase [Elusimicrobiota bacterium]
MADGLWERDGIYYFSMRHPVTKQRIRKKIGTNRKAALRIVAKLKNDLLNERFGIDLEERAPTFAEFSQKYLDLVKPHKKSWKEDEASIETLMPAFGHLPLNAITMAMADDFLVARAEQFVQPPLRGRFGTEEGIAEWSRTHKPKLVSKTTANKDVKCLRAILNMAVRRKLIRSNPVARVKLFDEKKAKRKRLLQPQEIKALREAAEVLESERDARDMILLGLLMGRRRGEFLSLKWKNVDFETESIYFPETKDGDPQQPPMPREVAQLLAERRDRAEAAGMKSLYVFPGRDGKGHRKSIDTAFNTIKRRAGLPFLHYHDLRHAYISYAVMKGLDLMTIASLVGHTTADQIQERYGHLRREHKVASVEHFAPVMGAMLGLDEKKPPAPGAVVPAAPGDLHAWKTLATDWPQSQVRRETLN